MVCWMVILYLNKHTRTWNNTFCTSEWGQEHALALCREVRVFKVPGLRKEQPMTFGDYIDKTHSSCISKVTLEEIVFSTWYSGRTILLGDGKLASEWSSKKCCKLIFRSNPLQTNKSLYKMGIR